MRLSYQQPAANNCKIVYANLMKFNLIFAICCGFEFCDFKFFIIWVTGLNMNMNNFIDWRDDELEH